MIGLIIQGKKLRPTLFGLPVLASSQMLDVSTMKNDKPVRNKDLDIWLEFIDALLFHK